MILKSKFDRRKFQILFHKSQKKTPLGSSENFPSVFWGEIESFEGQKIGDILFCKFIAPIPLLVVLSRPPDAPKPTWVLWWLKGQEGRHWHARAQHQTRTCCNEDGCFHSQAALLKCSILIDPLMPSMEAWPE